MPPFPCSEPLADHYDLSRSLPKNHTLAAISRVRSEATKRTRPQSLDDGLEIAEGATAALELERLLFQGGAMTAAERLHPRDPLLRYCAVDTMSMVRLLEGLRELA